MKSKIKNLASRRSGKKSKTHKSPRIYRFIPDIFDKHASKFNRKQVFGAYSNALRIFTLLIFAIAIFILAYDLKKNIEAKEKIDLERADISKEISFWQSFLKKNNDYRDGYLRLSILEYKIGDYGKARFYLGKALEIDPNFEKGKELEKALSFK